MNLATRGARALVFMTAHGCARYVTAAIESLAWQTHREVQVLFVDDASTDGTGDVARGVLERHFEGRHRFVRNAERWGKARNAHVHLRAELQEGDFVAILDADDQLISATALAELAAEYDAGFDVVWSRFVTDTGQPGCSGPLDPFRPPRGQGWKTSHFFSFRGELLQGVPQDYFQDEHGQWLQSACDQAIAWPMLDQTRRWRHLPQVMLRYTSANPQSHHNLGPQANAYSSRQQSRNAEIVLAKPPLPCRRWLLAEHGAADHAVAVLMQRVAVSAPTPAATVAPAILAGPAAPDPASPWRHAAAATLAARCPALPLLALDDPANAPDVALAWRWWHWLQAGGGAPRVLEIGAGTLAPLLHALVQGLGGQITSVHGDREAALQLQARLQAAGLPADVQWVPLAQAEFDGVQARFPELGRLADEASGYDVAIVGTAASPDGARAALLALPMIAPRLAAAGFRLCLWSPQDPAPLREAQSLWARAVPELGYAPRSLGGGGLVVHSHAGP